MRVSVTMAWLRRDAPTPPISTDEFGAAAGDSRVVGPWCDRGDDALNVMANEHARDAVGDKESGACGAHAVFAAPSVQGLLRARRVGDEVQGKMARVRGTPVDALHVAAADPARDARAEATADGAAGVHAVGAAPSVQILLRATYADDEVRGEVARSGGVPVDALEMHWAVWPMGRGGGTVTHTTGSAGVDGGRSSRTAAAGAASGYNVLNKPYAESHLVLPVATERAKSHLVLPVVTELAKTHPVLPVASEPQCASGIAGAIDESPPCPGDDRPDLLGFACSDDGEAAATGLCPASLPLRQSPSTHPVLPVASEPPCAPGMPGATEESLPCPGDDRLDLPGLACRDDGEAAVTGHRPASMPLRHSPTTQAQPEAGDDAYRPGLAGGLVLLLQLRGGGNELDAYFPMRVQGVSGPILTFAALTGVVMEGRAGAFCRYNSSTSRVTTLLAIATFLARAK